MTTKITNLKLVIDGQPYEWQEQFITGKQIKELAKITFEKEIYLSLKDPADDEPVSDETKVDLARPGIEHFFVKKKYKFTINKVPFESWNQFITGKEIRELGQISQGDKIILEIPGDFEDESVENETKVDLARPGVEHFSTSHVGNLEIIVNMVIKPWPHLEISYDQVVELAFGVQPNNEKSLYTVTYNDGPGQNPQGSMVKGQTVRIKSKMKFYVSPTTES